MPTQAEDHVDNDLPGPDGGMSDAAESVAPAAPATDDKSDFTTDEDASDWELDVNDLGEMDFKMKIQHGEVRAGARKATSGWHRVNETSEWAKDMVAHIHNGRIARRHPPSGNESWKVLYTLPNGVVVSKTYSGDGRPFAGLRKTRTTRAHAQRATGQQRQHRQQQQQQQQQATAAATSEQHHQHQQQCSRGLEMCIQWLVERSST